MPERLAEFQNVDGVVAFAHGTGCGMDTPGFDLCSATGQIAGGANVILFTTGRGSMFGAKAGREAA